MLEKLAFLQGYKEVMEKAGGSELYIQDLADRLPEVDAALVRDNTRGIERKVAGPLTFAALMAADGGLLASALGKNWVKGAYIGGVSAAALHVLLKTVIDKNKDASAQKMLAKAKKISGEKLAFLHGYAEVMEKVAEMTASDKDLAASAGILAGTTAGGLATQAWMKRVLAKGMSDQDLAKANEIAKKYKLKVPLNYTSGMAPNYNPFTKDIHVNMGLSEALHEIGHARAYRRYGKLAKPMAITRHAAPAATGLAGIAMALSDDETASKNAPLVAASGSLPTLIDEALASGLALKDLKKLYGWKGVAKGLKKLTPGYLSYLMQPAASAFLPLLLRGLKRHTEEPSSVVNKAASITRDYEYFLGYLDTLQKVAAKGITSDLTTLSHSESDLRPDTKPQRSQAPSISSSMRGLMGGSQSAASFSPAAAESTRTSTPGSSFDFGAVRGAKVQPWTGDEIRSATPEEMLTSRSLGRPWYNQEAPKTLREAGTVAAEILSNLYAPRPSVALRTDASGIEHFI
jgi:hypothetical protein